MYNLKLIVGVDELIKEFDAKSEPIVVDVNFDTNSSDSIDVLYHVLTW